MERWISFPLLPAGASVLPPLSWVHSRSELLHIQTSLLSPICNGPLGVLDGFLQRAFAPLSLHSYGRFAPVT